VRRAVALLLGVMALSACAGGSASGPPLAGKFVRPGQPKVDLGGPPAAEGGGKPDTVGARSTSMGTTVENTDPGLAAALLLEVVAPTVESHLRVAGEYKRLHIFDAAYERFVRAAKKAPTRAEPHDGMARLWRDWGFPDRALTASYRAVYLNPESAPAHNTLGTILDALGQYDAARRAYERALMLDPTAAWASNNLCYLELRQGRLAEAQSLCEWSLRVAPALSPARNNLALTHAAAGDLDQARRELMAPGDGATEHYNVGVVQLDAGQYQAAIRSFETALKLRPDFPAAKAYAHLARVRMLRGSN
jgi:tetratricopeptide (TPR) repeat protein